MSLADKQYHSLLEDILENGCTTSDRTGTGTKSVFGRQIRFKMGEGFPLLTTKRLHLRSIIHELIWFLNGDTNIKYLVDNNVNIWNEWPYKAYVEKAELYLNLNRSDISKIDLSKFSPSHLYNNERALTLEEFKAEIKNNNEFAKIYGDLGPVYGKQWVAWNKYSVVNGEVGKSQINQIENAISRLKSHPDCRRILVTALNPAEIPDMKLPPCHYGFQLRSYKMSLQERFDYYLSTNIVEDSDILSRKSHKFLDDNNIPSRKLNLMWNQRSVDSFLGLPFNIASYALLLHMIAQQVNMVPDELIGTLGDTHLYLNHIEYANIQLSRSVDEYDAPSLKLKKAKDIFSYSFEDFEILDYECFPNWKNVPIAI